MKLGLAHLNVLTKCDLINGADELPEEILEVDSYYVLNKTSFKLIDDGSTRKMCMFNKLAIKFSETLDE